MYPSATVVRLALSQALYLSAVSVGLTLTGIVGQMLAPDKALATIPYALIAVATAVVTTPLSLAMGRWGRRPWFLFGAAAGACGGAVSALAILRGDFWLFCLGNALMGVYQASTQYYRYAVADAVPAASRPRAIAWVMAGGVIAAVAGPWIGAEARDWFAPVSFAGSYAAVTLLSLVALALLVGLDLPRPSAAEIAGDVRPLPEIARQPAFVAALANSALGYAVMIFVMTATPLAALACALSVDQAASIIQWHLVGMFAPSFLAGPLIGRIGVTRVLLLGSGLIAMGAGIALSGIALEHFWLSLFLNGVGWNFLYVGGTTLMTAVPRPAERARVQGIAEFITFGVTAAGSLAAGIAWQALGWQAVNLIALGLLAPTVAATLWHGAAARRTVSV